VACSGGGEIRIVDPVSGAGWRLCPSPGEDWKPAWSPDGATVCFDRTVAGGTRLWACTLSGWDFPLADEPSSGGAWSPDGSRLAWNGRDGRVLEGPVDGSTRWTVGEGLLASALHRWSPDGASIALVGIAESDPELDWDIWIYDVASRTLRRVPGGPDASTLWDGEPAWSPDGVSLYYLEADDRFTDLWSASPGSAWPARRILRDERGKMGLRISPDGVRAAWFDPQEKENALWIADLASGTATILLE
jgi:Tol biopolymer transport system component